METKDKIIVPQSSSKTDKGTLAEDILKEMDAQSMLDEFIDPEIGEANIEIVFADSPLVANVHKKPTE